MAGRGRGRGKPLVPLGGDQSLGRTEILPPILQPPPSYPPLEYKPLPTTVSSDLRYLVILKKEYAEAMHDSPYNVLPIVVKKDIERYSDRYQDLLSIKQGYESRYDWTRMPAELKPAEKKRKIDKTKDPKLKKKVKKEVDIESKLQELEKKETTQQSDAEEDQKDDEETEEKDVEDKVEDEEEEADEEMDEGTDYVNNYFDNGENYEDDEENLDDGAIF